MTSSATIGVPHLPQAENLGASAVNADVVKAVECFATFCCDWKGGELHGVADYRLEWLNPSVRKIVFDVQEINVQFVFQLQEEESEVQPTGCNHNRKNGLKSGSCCKPSSKDIVQKLRYEQTPRQLWIRFPKENITRFRIIFKLKETAKSVKWWKQHHFLHSSGDDAVNSRSLLPVIDTLPMDWKIRVCVPPEFTAWVPTRIYTRKPPSTCSECKRVLCSFGTRSTPPELLGFVIAKHLMQINLLEAPVPVRVWCQSSVHVNAQNLAAVFRVLLKGLNLLLPGYAFKCYSVVVIPSSWNILGLALRSGVFMNASVIERCSLSNVSSYQLCAHEMSHQWFGLAIGSLEPWMNEAFACYCEVRIPQLGLEYSDDDAFTQLLLVGCVRERLLSDCLKNTPPGNRSIISANDTVCRNKGYLILLHLLLRLGSPALFDKLLCGWCSVHVNKRVSSEDLLAYYNSFLSSNKLRKDLELRESDLRYWLDNEDFPDVLRPPRSNESLSRMLKIVNAGACLRDRSIFREWAKLPYRRELWCLMLDALRISDTAGSKKSILTSLATEQPSLIPRDDLEIEARLLDVAIHLRIHELYSSVDKYVVKHQSMGIFLLGELLFGGVAERKLALDIRKKLRGCQMSDASQTTENLFREHNVTEENYMRESSEGATEETSSDYESDDEPTNGVKRVNGYSNGHILKRPKPDVHVARSSSKRLK
eukprot:TRINITY_DN6992_c0_g1_i1.p1 TRINITY_DN6992_c0_g1~~TRINITY_DN6992_c0_g1_i1.p1  ORF type:complete len:707 (+),score=70.80 TRINITY_DN6992_c0_g1_i1:360-2480(+)